MWGTDLGSLGDLVAEDLALYVAEVCVQRYRLQNQKERKKKKKWIYELKVFDEITQRKTYHFIAYRASFLACFVSLVRISEAFETSSFTTLDDFLYFGLRYKKPSRMLGYVVWFSLVYVILWDHKCWYDYILKIFSARFTYN